MSVKKRGKVWHISFQLHGKAVRRSAGIGATRKQALELEAKLKKQIHDDYHNDSMDRAPDRTFGEAMVRWLQTDAPKSMYKHIKAVRPFMENVSLKKSLEATEVMREAFLDKGLKHNTINRRLAVVRRVLNLAYKRWCWLDEPLGLKIETYSEKEFARDVHLTVDEAVALIEAVEHKEVKKAILGYLVSGLRKSELLRLQPENWNNGLILLGTNQKGKRATAVPVPSDFHHLFEDLPFKITEHQLRNHFEKARDKLGMNHVWLHDLRHTYGSWVALDPETPLAVLRDLMRHSSVATTSKYVHFKTDTKVKAAESLGKSLTKLAQIDKTKRTMH